MPPAIVAHPEGGAHRLGLARADEARKADDLAGANVERRVDHGAVRRRQTIDAQRLVAGLEADGGKSSEMTRPVISRTSSSSPAVLASRVAT